MTDEEQKPLDKDVLDALRLEASDLSPKGQRELEEKAVLIKQLLQREYGKYISPLRLEEINNNKVEEMFIHAKKDEFVELSLNWSDEHQAPNNETIFSEAGARYYTREILNKNNMYYMYTSAEKKMAEVYDSLLDKYGEDVHRLFFDGDIEASKKQTIFADLQKDEIFSLYGGYTNPEEIEDTEENLEDVYGISIADELVALRDVTDYWLKMNEESRQGAIEDFGSEESAKSVMKKAIENTILAHEIVHTFEPN